MQLLQRLQSFYKVVSAYLRSFIIQEANTWQNLEDTVRRIGYHWGEFDIHDFVTWLSEKCGREIRLVPSCTPAHLDGLWLTSDEAEFSELTPPTRGGASTD